jgi:hypothetical protein
VQAACCCLGTVDICTHPGLLSKDTSQHACDIGSMRRIHESLKFTLGAGLNPSASAMLPLLRTLLAWFQWNIDMMRYVRGDDPTLAVVQGNVRACRKRIVTSE